MKYGISNTTGQIDLTEARNILNYAQIVGVNTLDTARGYGTAENVLGEVGCSDFNIITKIGQCNVDQKSTKEFIVGQIRESCARLNVPELQGVLLHAPEQLLDVSPEYADSIFAGLELARELKIVRKIGVSVYTPVELKLLTERYDFDVVQLPLPAIDGRWLDSNMLPSLSKKGIELHARSVFLQGLLLQAQDERHSYFDQWQNLWKNWDELLLDLNVSALDLCLYLVSQNSYIDKFVIGVQSGMQLQQCIESDLTGLDFILPDHLIQLDENLLNPSQWTIK